MDLDSLNKGIRAEIHRLDERRAFLLQQIVHLDALDIMGKTDDAKVGLTGEPSRTVPEESLLSHD
ncbi:MAG: hypothetical protein ACWGQW_12750, partial [bacterium]